MNISDITRAEVRYHARGSVAAAGASRSCSRDARQHAWRADRVHRSRGEPAARRHCHLREVCLRWLDRDVPDLNEVRDTVRDMVSASRRASEVIQSLPQKRVLDMTDVLNDAVSLTQPVLRRHGTSLRPDLASSLPPVSGDQVQLQQVMADLIVNGRDAITPVGDGPREIALRSRRDGASHNIAVDVQDSGGGIAPGDEERIFDAFFTTKADGMGMGLSICRLIVEKNGGTLWASRNFERGRTFSFTLPLEEAQKP